MFDPLTLIRKTFRHLSRVLFKEYFKKLNQSRRVVAFLVLSLSVPTKRMPTIIKAFWICSFFYVFHESNDQTNFISQFPHRLSIYFPPFFSFFKRKTFFFELENVHKDISYLCIFISEFRLVLRPFIVFPIFIHSWLKRDLFHWEKKSWRPVAVGDFSTRGDAVQKSSLDFLKFFSNLPFFFFWKFHRIWHHFRNFSNLTLD